MSSNTQSPANPANAINPASSTKQVKRPNQIYQLRVTLLEGEPPMPPIWRRFRVASDVTLPKLHRILQAVMGWSNYHLHEFTTVDGRRYGVPDPEYKNEPSMKVITEWGVKLNRLATSAGEKFTYKYDFGDSWKHEIVVEKTLLGQVGQVGQVRQEGVDCPVCLEGAGGCPPEDVGGAGRYAEFLEAIGDPQHEDHEEMMEGAGLREGEEFDTHTFDLEAVNRKLRLLR